ncbi:aspartyl-phosphate phosphatase Spo0E family protein [Bacillus sp. T33-2]|uniref:aspartyl-phosphate phosphatase Spo0E family protein n=1 Tax=Bacillus sp. T33-2 TaxID=2054168 RepID=UPI000C78A2C6|nr:aspartyl-phosphate phosphatase Spo0E family protein [Bacillus sp. T33-2]PLR95498.1 hypothetical protein CVD19_13845 [Bacillus sp. T33-2]
MCRNSLLRDIENCRKQMVELASLTSLSNEQVLKASTKLDHLLNRYHGLSSK